MKRGSVQRDDFIAQNMGLVHACAGRFRGRGVEYDDLFQAGCMGLVKACDGFSCFCGSRGKEEKCGNRKH